VRFGDVSGREIVVALMGVRLKSKLVCGREYESFLNTERKWVRRKHFYPTRKLN